MSEHAVDTCCRSPAIGLGPLAWCTAAGISIRSGSPPLEVHLDPGKPRLSGGCFYVPGFRQPFSALPRRRLHRAPPARRRTGECEEPGTGRRVGVRTVVCLNDAVTLADYATERMEQLEGLSKRKPKRKASSAQRESV